MIEFKKSPEDFLAAGLEEAKYALLSAEKNLEEQQSLLRVYEEARAEARAVVERYETALTKVSGREGTVSGASVSTGPAAPGAVLGNRTSARGRALLAMGLNPGMLMMSASREDQDAAIRNIRDSLYMLFPRATPSTVADIFEVFGIEFFAALPEDPEVREALSLQDLRRSRPGRKFRDNEGRVWTHRGISMESPGGGEQMLLATFVRDLGPITRADEEEETSDERRNTP